jgi:hypothetical protein
MESYLFYQTAVNVFPSGCTRVIGIASAFGSIRIYFIDYSSSSNTKFSVSLYEQYGVHDVFEVNRSTCDENVIKWLNYDRIGSSETTAVILDSYWIQIIERCVPGFLIYLNQHDTSSTTIKRPDTVITVRGALVLKGEAKYAVSDLETASNELIDKFHQTAVNAFPSGCTRVIGIASAFEERVRFIVDMFKVMRWMQSISEPNERYHLYPGIRMETRNHHHVTWTSQGLLKEYNHRIDYTVQLNRINQVYNTVPKPLHVEYGYVNNNPNFPSSCMITRLGYVLTKENMIRFRLTK